MKKSWPETSTTRLGRAVGRERDELVVDLAAGVPLAHADHGLAVRRDDAVGIAQRVRLRRLRGDRLRLRAGAVHAIEAAVGEVGVEDGVAVVPDGAAAVLVHAGSRVRAGRESGRRPRRRAAPRRRPCGRPRRRAPRPSGRGPRRRRRSRSAGSTPARRGRRRAQPATCRRGGSSRRLLYRLPRRLSSAVRRR